MRTVEDIRNYAERYDLENDSPFAEDEFQFQSQFLDVVEGVQGMIKFEDSDKKSGCDCAKRNATLFGLKNVGSDLKAPADNMGFVKYHGREYSPTWGGYDGGVEASIEGEWDGVLFENLRTDLDRCKQAAENDNFEDSFLELGKFVWKVSDKGANAGFFKYKYVLESHGVKLYIHSNPIGPVIPVRVRFGFECLARTDLFEAVETLRKELQISGFTWRTETLSRVDMQVLLPVDIYEFMAAMKPQRVITRCRGKVDFVCDAKTMRLQTILLRSSNAELCIYDKKAQVWESDAIYFETFHRWVLRGEMPEHLTRVEFRFRRGLLRRYGVNTFKDLRSSQAAICQLFGSEWFRILDRDKVRGSEKEIANSPIWQRTLDAFLFYFGRDFRKSDRSKHDLKAYKPKCESPKIDRVFKQGLGCLASVASLTLTKVLDGREVVDFLLGKLSVSADVLYNKVIRKQIVNEVRRLFVPALDEKSNFDCQQEISLSLVHPAIASYLSCFS